MGRKPKPKSPPKSPTLPSVPFDQNNILLRNQKHKKALVAIALGLAFHYNEILKSWKTCGSSNICRAEKLTAYITMIYGVSKPAVFMTESTRRLLNKLSKKLAGKVLMEKDSKWDSSVLISIIYSAVEYGLSSVWEWVRYSTQCLRRHNCENDDILIWIMNMKTKCCGVKDDDIMYECDEDGQNCETTDIDSTYGQTKGLCILFFNQLPVITLGAVVWTLFVLSDQVPEVEHNPEDTDEPATESSNKTTVKGKKGNKDKTNPDIKDKEGSKDKTNPDIKHKKGSKDKTTPDKNSSRNKNSPKNSKAKVNKKKKACPDIQELEVYCPLCKEDYFACFPDPLTICCGDCGRDAKPPPNGLDNLITKNLNPIVSAKKDNNNQLFLDKYSQASESSPIVKLWFEPGPHQHANEAFSANVESGTVIAEEELIAFSSTIQDKLQTCILRSATKNDQNDLENAPFDNDDNELLQIFANLITDKEMGLEVELTPTKTATIYPKIQTQPNPKPNDNHVT